MKAAAIPDNETERLAALRSYEILDTSMSDQEYDDLVRLAAAICGTSMAVINFVDSDRQWGKAMYGLGSTEAPREASFCAHTILGADVFEVPDTHEDERFADNPQVTEIPHLRFYAGAPVVDEDGFALGSICAVDTVPRSLDELQREALMRLARQVGAQLALRRANARLRELDKLKDQFVSLVSHELRTPITSITGFVELLSGEQLDDTQMEYLAIVSLNAERLLLLVDDLLTLAQIETEGMRVTREPTDLGQLVRRSAAGLGPLAEKAGLSFDCAVPDEPVQVVGDPLRLAQLLDNLVGNAVKYTKAGGVRVTLERNGRSATVTIDDDGIGIPADEQAKLFTRFFRASTATDAGVRGSGLGLAITKAIAEAHGGSIAVESAVGRGTTVRVVLPA